MKYYEKHASVSNPQQMFAEAVEAHQKGQLEQAERLYQRLSKQFPAAIEPTHYLGLLKHQQGQNDKALSLVKKAHQMAPKNPVILYNLGRIHQALHQYDQATASYQKALSLNPNHAMCYNNLGSVLEKQGNFLEAGRHYRQALQLDPNCIEALTNYGNYLRSKGQLSAAIENLHKAIQLMPGYANALLNLAIAHQQAGDIDQAHTLLLNALKIAPNNPKIRSAFLFNLNYSIRHTPKEIYQCHLKYGFNAQPDIQVFLPSPRKVPLRIGYVSADLRIHSVAYFMRAILNHHDQNKFQIYIYSNSACEDEISNQLRQLCHRWINISDIDDKQAYKIIRGDGIDVLVDLSGHTAGNRQALFAMKPAPVQVTYLGYPNTTGNSAINYRLVDEWTDPEQLDDELHTEQLVRLEGGFLCYTPVEHSPAVNPLPALSKGHISFGCFNNLSKLSPPLISCWAKLLGQIDDATITLKSKAFNDAIIRDKWLNRFSSQGIDEHRIHLLPYEKNTKSHLTKYHAIDIALDSFPYNGTTTTCEALWMGVPVITWAGERHASRTGASLLISIGLDEFVTKNEEEYIDKAVELASDITHLSKLRTDLRERMKQSNLMDGARLTRNLEALYQKWIDNLEKRP